MRPHGVPAVLGFKKATVQRHQELHVPRVRRCEQGQRIETESPPARTSISGKYVTKSADMTAASAVNLTKVPDDWKTSWDPAKKSAASILLQAERKRDLIHAGKSAHQITEDSDTQLFKSCDYQLAKLNDDMEAVYKYWLDVTGGDAREKVIRKGQQLIKKVLCTRISTQLMFHFDREKEKQRNSQQIIGYAMQKRLGTPMIDSMVSTM